MVYVSNVFPCMRTKKWRYDQVAYMVADTTAELHLEAAKLGLRRTWYTGSYYNLTKLRHRIALRRGAKLIDNITEFTDITRRMIDGTR